MNAALIILEGEKKTFPFLSSEANFFFQSKFSLFYYCHKNAFFDEAFISKPPREKEERERDILPPIIDKLQIKVM
jgi:hypothetical protein